MKDTSPEIERLFRDMILRRSGEERLKMGCSMHRFAQMVVRASVLATNPHATTAELRRAAFLRFYASDFDAAARDRILAALEQTQSAAAGP